MTHLSIQYTMCSGPGETTPFANGGTEEVDNVDKGYDSEGNESERCECPCSGHIFKHCYTGVAEGRSDEE